MDLPDPTPLAGRELDDVFGGVDSNAEFSLEGNGRKVSVRFGPKFPIAIVYAPQTRNVVCFEPMTGLTDGFNLAHEGVFKNLQSIPPGGTWTESFWIRPAVLAPSAFSDAETSALSAHVRGVLVRQIVNEIIRRDPIRQRRPLLRIARIVGPLPGIAQDPCCGRSRP